MSLRVWISPAVFVDGTNFSKAEQYCTGGFVNWFPVNSDGTAASPWVITVGRAPDWTAAEADLELDDLFGGDLPANIDTVDELRNLLRTRTVADVPIARRNRITAVLDEYGVQRADFVGTTPLWKVFQRVVSTLSERDYNFASGFRF
jgi:hypothetical protein